MNKHISTFHGWRNRDINETGSSAKKVMYSFQVKDTSEFAASMKELRPEHGNPEVLYFFTEVEGGFDTTLVTFTERAKTFMEQWFQTKGYDSESFFSVNNPVEYS